MQYSDAILNLFGAPKLSLLTVCGANELPNVPDYLSSAIWHYIAGATHGNEVARHLELAFVRRTNAAANNYSNGRSCLLQYIEGVASQQHHLGRYLSALTHFEQCLNSVWQAAELFNRIEHSILGKEFKCGTLFKQGENSDLERINRLNNVVKHFDAKQAERSSTPIWITNTGLESADTVLSFEELHENVTALSEIARQSFVEIPREALERKQRQNTPT
jgi:hypothetical protein